jgi:SAM-dependent methyltransferase
MSGPVDLYRIYREFGDPVVAEVRTETFGDDMGQNSWTTVEEDAQIAPGLEVPPGGHVLEIASGSGGPAIHLARLLDCRVTGIDHDPGGVETATRTASDCGESHRVRFDIADADTRLPFDSDSFDGLICIDALNHLRNRSGVLGEWRRVLRPGRRALFTDPVVVTGPVTNEELALRSSIGHFLFVPPGVNERLIEQAGLRLVRQEDRSEAAATIAGRWHEARQKRRDALVALEGGPRFEGLQRFFAIVRDLARERRLSRWLYVVEKV